MESTNNRDTIKKLREELERHQIGDLTIFEFFSAIVDAMDELAFSIDRIETDEAERN